MGANYGMGMGSMKSYRAIRHDVVREKQKLNIDEVHHPSEKKEQITKVLNGKKDLKILELFCGEGNLTNTYQNFGNVTCYDKKLKTGDSFREYHRLIADKKTFDVVDLDPYGFPNRFFPDIYLLINNGYLFVTCPIPSVNILHGITKTHLYSYFESDNPSINIIIEKFALYGLSHWRKVELIDLIKMDRMYRFVFAVEKIKSTEYTGVNNR